VINSGRSLFLTALIFLLMLATLVFMSNAINNSEDFSKLYSILLIVNALGLLAMVYLIGRNIKRLLEQLKEKRPGSRLTLRMVTTFVLLAIIPLLIVYWFSTDFIRRGIDNWFDVRIEKALTDSLELSKESLGLRMRELLKTTENMAEDLTESSQSNISISALDLSSLQGELNTTVMNTLNLDTSKLDN
jgi:nitrogen fixation/metabolism regulation signal transduction histidine kinase